MTSAILVSGSDRRPSLALAAGLACEVAALSGDGTLLIEAGVVARRLNPTLLAAPGARRIEQGLRGIGLRASARGLICHLAVDGHEPLAATEVALETTDAELAIVHVPGELWLPALASDLRIAGACLLVSLPAERSLAALAVAELERRGIPRGMATRSPGPLASRRAVAGGGLGGGHTDDARRIVRRLLGLGAPRELGAPPRQKRGQALPAVLGAGL